MSYRNQVKYDYNPDRGLFRDSGRRRRRLVFGLIATAAVVAGALLLRPGLRTLLEIVDTGTEPRATRTGPAIALALPGKENASSVPGRRVPNFPFEPRVPARAAQASHAGAWEGVTVAAGDSLALIFGRLGLSSSDLHEILQSGSDASALRRIKPGQTLRVRADDGKVLEMVYEFDYRRSLHVRSIDGAFATEVIETEPEIRDASAAVEINNSLFLAGQAAGLSDNVIMQLTEIFGWDIDFALDIRSGDHFSVIYDEIYKNGEKIKDGEIRAAEFVNRNRRLRAVRYLNDNGRPGYYSDTGDAMRKAFLRTPVNFSRISSRFNLSRRHPVLNTIRAHRGVDYAAPHGTPVRSTADGKLVFVGSKGGYGRTAIIQHGDVYSTLYAHMSRFARATKRGTLVGQGQTIGYVGKTGLATGPHLHYEFRINGVHRNPLTVELPNASPIDKRYVEDFKAKSAPLLAQLDDLARQRGEDEKRVAKTDSPQLIASAISDQRN